MSEGHAIMTQVTEQPLESSDRQAWQPNSETRAVARDYFTEVFAPPNLDQLVQGVATGPEHDDSAVGLIYDEALVDLIRLLEEVRFSVSVAAMYAHGARDKLRPMRESHHEWPHSVGLSPKVRALLATYTQNTHPPDELIFDPSALLGGARLLGGWWAGQLVDSAVVRGISALDRVAILVSCAAGRIDPRRMPAFRSRELGRLSGAFGSDGEWETLLGLTENEVFLFVKDARDGHVHRRRLPTELHGDFVTSGRDIAGRSVSTVGMDPDLQLAVATALFRDVIVPAISSAGALIARRSTPLDERLL
jgi:hypothetical protein